MLKRFLALAAAAALTASLALVATAGDYHVGRTLICSDCHIAHGSQSHGYSASDSLTWQWTVVSGAHEYLLRGETVNNACLNCHNGRPGIPDVLGDPTDIEPHGRSAGALNVPDGGQHGYNNDARYTQSTGHTLWSTDAAPGTGTVVHNGFTSPNTTTHGLECSDCHRVHGNKYFRNMMGDTVTSTATFINQAWRGTQVFYEINAAPTPGSGAWVLEKQAHNYDNDNVQYVEVDQNKSMYGQWCSTCHPNFHGAPGAAEIGPANGDPLYRHPTAGVNMGTGSWRITDATHRLKVMSVNGRWAATGSGADSTSATMTPSCFSCHKSHGNKNNFGLVFVLPQGDDAASAGGGASSTPGNPAYQQPARVATMTEEGDGGQYRDLCRNCHGQGRWPTGNPSNFH